MIGAADSQARSSPRPENQRSAAHPQVSHRPRSVGGIAAPADSREPSSPQADSTEAGREASHEDPESCLVFLTIAMAFADMCYSRSILVRV